MLNTRESWPIMSFPRFLQFDNKIFVSFPWQSDDMLGRSVGLLQFDNKIFVNEQNASEDNQPSLASYTF